MWSQREGDRHEERPPRVSNNSEVVIMDERTIATISDSVLPSGSNLNVTKSSKVHIGPKFVSVTQNVQNKEVVLGRILGLELESSKRARRIRCSVAVFVCWAILVAAGLATYLIYVSIPGHPSRLNIGLNEVWYLRRDDWQALPPYGMEFHNLPLEIVIIGHSAANYCNQRYRCIEQMLIIQQDHLRRGLYDIGPNFLVGGNGYVFEGRGANIFPAMVTSYNRRSITIMFIGNYETDMPDQAQFDHLNVLLNVLVKERVLTSSYTLFGQCQVAPLTVSPGTQILRRMDNFAHWNPANISGCVRSVTPG